MNGKSDTESESRPEGHSPELQMTTQTTTRQEDRSTDCGPGSSSATKWGAWEVTEEKADESAREKAKTAAAAACKGDCPKKKSCVYKETSSELLETEEYQPEEGGVLEYRTKARSSGRCQCE